MIRVVTVLEVEHAPRRDKLRESELEPLRAVRSEREPYALLSLSLLPPFPPLSSSTSPFSFFSPLSLPPSQANPSKTRRLYSPSPPLSSFASLTGRHPFLFTPPAKQVFAPSPSLPVLPSQRVSTINMLSGTCSARHLRLAPAFLSLSLCPLVPLRRLCPAH